MESSCEYIEYAVEDSQQGVILQLAVLAGGKQLPAVIEKYQHVTKCYTMPNAWTDSRF